MKLYMEIMLFLRHVKFNFSRYGNRITTKIMFNNPCCKLLFLSLPAAFPWTPDAAVAMFSPLQQLIPTGPLSVMWKKLYREKFNLFRIVDLTHNKIIDVYINRFSNQLKFEWTIKVLPSAEQNKNITAFTSESSCRTRRPDKQLIAWFPISIP